MNRVTCASCGSHNVSARLEDQEFEWGTGRDAVKLSARVPVYECDDCAFVFTDEVGETLRHEAICRHLGVLSPAEIQALREKYGFSRAEFARLTQIGEASLARWEAGILIQNRALDQYLRLLAAPENLARLRETRRASAQARTEPRFRVISIQEWRAEAQSFSLHAVGA